MTTRIVKRGDHYVIQEKVIFWWWWDVEYGGGGTRWFYDLESAKDYIKINLGCDVVVHES
jgi:hypothetical protein